MKKFNIIHACLIFLTTNFIIASQKLELYNQSFHTQSDAQKALDDFLNSEKVKNFTFTENKSVILELEDGSQLEILLIKKPLYAGYFFSSKENFETMKLNTCLEDLGSGNF